MRRFFALFVVLFLVSFSVLVFAEPPELIPDDSLPTGVGDLVAVSTFGSKSDYYICYTFQTAYGDVVTYVYHVGGPRVTGVSELGVSLSHIISPSD